MHLTTLVGILEREQTERPSGAVREKLARLYAERGLHQEAREQRSLADAGEAATPTPRSG